MLKFFGLLFAVCAFDMGIAFADVKQVRVDGSSTVFPISEAVAEEFGRENRDIRVTVGTSGTGGGFKKFALGEIDINNASRQIKNSEKKTAQKNKVDFLELPIAYDGITVVVNKQNDWVDHLTVDELKAIWKPGSKVKTWADVRKGWPKEKILLYGPGTDSGTFDFFTEAINGKSQASRNDFTQSEDDNVLVQGVMGDTSALGYFGYAYYEENKDRLKAVPVKSAKGKVVAPSFASIQDGSYEPLSRQVYIYVSKPAAKRSEVQKFINFYMTEAAPLVKEVGYIPLDAGLYKSNKQKFATFSK